MKDGIYWAGVTVPILINFRATEIGAVQVDPSGNEI